MLKHRTIRFNRLDRVDDVSESKSFGRFDLSKYLFVSCWTDSEDESIPQWHMYTQGMQGVRITFPRSPFHYQPLVPPAVWGAVIEGDLLSPIPFDRLFTDDYIVMPSFASKDQFERKVEYVDDLSRIYDGIVNIDIQKDGGARMQINEMHKLGRFKHKVWEFQSELRFVIFALPSLPLPPRGLGDQAFVDQLPAHVMTSIFHGVAPQASYIDADIDPDVIDSLTVTMGPLSSPGDKIVVEALLKEYTSAGRVVDSRLAGTIRTPMR